jgi:carbon monoxide dehydrogenase subunit G
MGLTLQVTSAPRNGEMNGMDMTGERRIPAPRGKVWDALNDPAVLKASIPGCDSLEKTSDHEMKASAAVKIGPISARFAGRVELSDIDPPNGYTISGEGQGGVAGFAKGGAKVALADDGPDTLLTYNVNAQVGGKIAQLGARLIDAAAKQMADAFFDRFTAILTPAPTTSATSPETAATMPETPSAATIIPTNLPEPPALSLFALVPSEIFGLPIVAWIGGVIYLGILFLLFGSLL